MYNRRLISKHDDTNEKKKKKFKTETEQLKTEKVKLVTESLEKVILEQF